MKKLILAALLALCSFTASSATEPSSLIRKQDLVETTLVEQVKQSTIVPEEDTIIEFRTDCYKIVFRAVNKFKVNGKTYVIGKSNYSYVNMLCIEGNCLSILTDHKRVIEINNVKYIRGVLEMIENLPDAYLEINA